MWPLASTTAILSSAFSDTGAILLTVLAVTVTAVIGLMGLGFGIRHVKRHVTGRKF